MSHIRMRWIGGGVAAAITLSACVLSSDTRGVPASVETLRGTVVTSPVRAHLRDGGLMVFPDGLRLTSAHAEGSGARYNALRNQKITGTAIIPLDSVIGFEVIQRRINPVRTVVYSTLATAGTAFGTAVAAIAIFGSCPTIYGDSAGVETLQAESFSYSIAPLLAKRDVDRMTIKPDSLGRIRLHVRNEALETHRLDHIELVEVRHAPSETAFPSPRGGAIVVGTLDPTARIRDAAGRDVSRELRAHDGLHIGSADAALEGAIAGGPTEDHLIITVPRTGPRDSLALILRARSSLLTTSVLYDHLIGRQGPMALDWMGRDLGRITHLAALGRWYGANFGMRVEVESADGWTPVIRLMDFGPTAWRAVGLALPAVQGRDDSIRVRLTFPVDGFRIDQVGVSHQMRRPEQRLLPIDRVIARDGVIRNDMREMLRSADGRDVETSPGQQFTIEFDAEMAAGSRTFFFAGQGHYVEWVRPSWMRHADARPFDPDSSTMRALLRDWRGGRDSLEAFFFRRRVPVL